MKLLALLASIPISLSLLLQKSLYLSMLALLLAASLGLPLPEDITLLLAGCLCKLGYGQVGYAILVGLVGVLTGDLVLFAVAYRLGPDVIKRRPFRWLITRTHVAQMKLQFRKHGNKIIFFGRFFVGIRSVMCVTAGLCRVPIWKFVLVDVSGAIITVPCLVGLGWWFSHSIQAVVRGMVAAEHIIGGVITAILLGWVIYIHLARRKPRTIAKIMDNSDTTDSSQDP